jgi:CBS domain-containing protein/SAM-dependent methyltransferase
MGMKVSDVMQRHVDFVERNTRILDIARIIFGRRINGVPVCDRGKVIGFISESDILSKFHPTMQEYTEDPFLSSNFEYMEEKAKGILELTAKDIMSKRSILVSKDDPLMKADSVMRIEGVGRLPVVDDKDHLIGIITKGDIFKALVGKNMPYFKNEEYHDWMAKHFSFAMGWNEGKSDMEIPPLVDLFRKNGVKKILDIECGSGDYSIALAEKGFQVLGFEGSVEAINEARNKWKKLPENIRRNISFVGGDYSTSLDTIKGHYDAAIFMNSSFMHLPTIYSQVLEKLDKILSKNSLIILQLSNYEKAIKSNNSLRRFVVRNSKIDSHWKHAYLWFYDPPEKKGDLLFLNVAIFDFDGRAWMLRGMSRVATKPFTREELKVLFNRFNFPQISFYGPEEGEPLFSNEFRPTKSDWLISVAKR